MRVNSHRIHKSNSRSPSRARQIEKLLAAQRVGLRNRLEAYDGAQMVKIVAANGESEGKEISIDRGGFRYYPDPSFVELVFLVIINRYGTKCDIYAMHNIGCRVIGILNI